MKAEFCTCVIATVMSASVCNGHVCVCECKVACTHTDREREAGVFYTNSLLTVKVCNPRLV